MVWATVHIIHSISIDSHYVCVFVSRIHFINGGAMYTNKILICYNHYGPKSITEHNKLAFVRAINLERQRHLATTIISTRSER